MPPMGISTFLKRTKSSGYARCLLFASRSRRRERKMQRFKSAGPIVRRLSPPRNPISHLRTNWIGDPAARAGPKRVRSARARNARRLDRELFRPQPGSASLSLSAASAASRETDRSRYRASGSAAPGTRSNVSAAARPAAHATPDALSRFRAGALRTRRQAAPRAP